MAQTNPMLQPTLILPPYGSNTIVPTVMFNGAQNLWASSGMPTSADYSKVAVFSTFNLGTSNNVIAGYSGTTSTSHAFFMSGSS